MRQHKSMTLAFAVGLGILAPAMGAAGPQYQLGDPNLDLALRQSGWQSERVPGEGLLLYPPQVAKEAAAVPAKVEAGQDSVREGSVEAGPDWERLRGLGWRVEQGADGSTLLYPPLPQPSAPEKPTSDTAQPEQTLDALLEASGWRVERDAQGGLLLYPHHRAEVKVTPCPGVATAPVRDAVIALPVDGLSDVKTIAAAWLGEYGDPQWRIGKIRQVNRVYLVSIVDKGRNSTLVHQIAVLGDNGLIVVLN